VDRTATVGPRAGVDSWARSTLSLLVSLPGVLRTGVALTEGGGRRLLFMPSDRTSTSALEWCDLDAYEDVPLNTTVRTGRPVIGTLDDLSGRYPDFVDRQSPEVLGIASVPLSASGQILGGIVLYYGALQTFDDQHLESLQRMGSELGETLVAAREARTVLGWEPDTETLPTGAVGATQVVSADLRCVRLAREFVRSTLTEWDVDPDTTHTAVLCVSELVTNAIIHTDAGCELRLVLLDAVLRVSVRDTGTATARLGSGSESVLAVRGRGLQLVDALSTRWGSELSASGLTVWCDLSVPQSPRRGA
jgi:anti-sigma regulatory factor (Ser/Thr protein kinase)